MISTAEGGGNVSRSFERAATVNTQSVPATIPVLTPKLPHLYEQYLGRLRASANVVARKREGLASDEDDEDYVRMRPVAEKTTRSTGAAYKEGSAPGAGLCPLPLPMLQVWS
jgi:hypothetical protein